MELKPQPKRNGFATFSLVLAIAALASTLTMTIVIPIFLAILSIMFGLLSRGNTSMSNHVSSGQPIICSMRPGDFTTTGHFIVITGLKDGKFIIKDPNSKERSNQLWDYQTLEHQISNLWAFQAL